MLFKLRCLIFDLFSCKEEIGLITEDYLELCNFAKVLGLLDLLLFTKSERVAREQTRVLALIGAESVTETQIAYRYLQAHGYTGSFSFNRRRMTFLPDLVQTLNSLVQNSVLSVEEFEVSEPEEFTGPEWSNRFETRYELCSH